MIPRQRSSSQPGKGEGGAEMDVWKLHQSRELKRRGRIKLWDDQTLQATLRERHSERGNPLKFVKGPFRRKKKPTYVLNNAIFLSLLIEEMLIKSSNQTE